VRMMKGAGGACAAHRAAFRAGLRVAKLTLVFEDSWLQVGWWSGGGERNNHECGTASMVRRVGMLSCKCEWVRGAKLAKRSSHAPQRGVLVVGWERERGSHAHWGGRLSVWGCWSGLARAHNSTSLGHLVAISAMISKF